MTLITINGTYENVRVELDAQPVPISKARV